MDRRVAVIPAMMALAAFAAMGQTATSAETVNAAGTRFNGSATFQAPPFAMPAVTGAAYSGEEVSERVQTLADGTKITQKNPGRRIFRDSQGRTRTERPLFAGPGYGGAQAPTSDPPIIVEITDPVAGFQYTLDTQNRMAHRSALPPPGTRPGMGRAAVTRSGTFEATVPPPSGATGVTAAVTTIQPVPGEVMGAMPGGVFRVGGGAQAGSENRPQMANEQLGTQTIDGVLAEGRRMTTTYPVGIQGNDRPIVVTTESWTSPELKITVLTKTNDPRFGENTFKINNLSRSEPDPNLFLPPADYTTVDEASPFTIKYTR